MTLDQIEDLAFKGLDMPDGLNMAEQLLFLEFRWLYQYARLIRMPPKRGRKEKMKILKEFNQNVFFVKRLIAANQLWNRIDAAAILYRNERTIENADKFVDAVYGIHCDPPDAAKRKKNEQTNI